MAHYVENLHKTLFYASTGATLDHVGADGLVLQTINLQEGPGEVREYLKYFQPLDVGEGLMLTGCAVSDPGSQSVAVSRHPEGDRESGANPDWRPTVLSRHELETRAMIRGLAAKIQGEHGRRKLAEAELEKERKKGDRGEPEPVVEPEPEPTQEPQGQAVEPEPVVDG